MLLALLSTLARAGEPACAPFEQHPEQLVCPSPQTHGATREDPLQWGTMAFGDLWQGMLVCPGGAVAEAHRSGSVGSIPAQSAPANPEIGSITAELGLPPADIIDRWEIRCPGMEPKVWFVNGYRCGDPCPPDGLTVAPRAIVQLFLSANLKSGDPNTAAALMLADKVTREHPDQELAWMAASLVWWRTDQHAQALGALRQIERFGPLNADQQLLRMGASMFSGDFAQAREAGEAVKGLFDDPGIQRLATCVVDATTAIDAGRLPAQGGMKDWCAGGISTCCEPAPTEGKKAKKTKKPKG